jgi:hypothetical protein
MAKIGKEFLSLAGEYRVCSELLKRSVFATITYGNRKSVDVYVIGSRKTPALRIEVKTSQQKKFVTSITQKGLATGCDAPDFWVLCQMKADKDRTIRERFFVLSHREICREQRKINRRYAKRYEAKHGHPPAPGGGVDNVSLDSVLQYEDAWDKIVLAAS